MTPSQFQLALVGATGYTGRLIVRELVRRGIDFVAVGRSKDKLDALQGPFERRVADASDAFAVREAIAGCHAVCSCVGPFVDHGEPTVAATVGSGVHYIDTTGEQAFMRAVFETYGPRASEKGVALVTGVGFDYVPGDMAAALAARALGERPDSVEIVYSVTRAKASDGTKRTGLRIASMPCYVWREGSLVPRRIGDDERTFSLPTGDVHVAFWPGGEPLTVPRHTGARNVSVYMRMPKVAARAVKGAGFAAPVLRAVVGGGTGGPSDEERARSRYVVVAEARTADRAKRCVVEGRDVYGMTAAACAEAMQRLASPGFAGAGALAPSEAFDPESFLSALGDYLAWGVE